MLLYNFDRNFIENDYSGIPNMLTFSTSETQQCFNVSFPSDNEYEFQEAITMIIGTSSDGLLPGDIPQANVIISDDDGTIINKNSRQ